MKQTPKTGPAKTPASFQSPCVVVERGEADTGACARGRLGAVPLGNTGTTVVEGTR